MKGIILGFGNMGQNHFERYKKLDTDIIAIIDNDEAKRKIAERYGIKAYATLDQYLKENGTNNIDFIDVCLPTNLHFPVLEKIMLTFADSPIAINVEKPVVRTTEEADKLDELAKHYKQIVFVAEVEHYNKRITDFFHSVPHPSHITISREVNLSYFSGETIPWFLNINLSGGIILDLMIHDFSLLDSRLGTATLLNGRFKHLKFMGTDKATVTLQYPQANCSAEITGSWLSTDIEHPIITTIKITDAKGVKHALVVDDYMVRGSMPDKDDPYYVEIKTFLEATKTKQLPHSLNEYTRVVRLANDIIKLAATKEPSCQSMHFQSVQQLEINNTLQSTQLDTANPSPGLSNSI